MLDGIKNYIHILQIGKGATLKSLFRMWSLKAVESALRQRFLEKHHVCYREKSGDEVKIHMT